MKDTEPEAAAGSTRADSVTVWPNLGEAGLTAVRVVVVETCALNDAQSRKDKKAPVRQEIPVLGDGAR